MATMEIKRGESRRGDLPNQLRLFGHESINVHSSRHTIAVGDIIRVSGGPTCQGSPLSARGVFRVEGLVFDPRIKGRTWLDCTRLECPPRGIHGLAVRRPDWSQAIACGRFLLYAAGPKYRRTDFPGVYWQPFAIKKLKTK